MKQYRVFDWRRNSTKTTNEKMLTWADVDRIGMEIVNSFDPRNEAVILESLRQRFINEPFLVCDGEIRVLYYTNSCSGNRYAYNFASAMWVRRR